MLIQPYVIIHFRHPDEKEILLNSTDTSESSVPNQGLVHKSHSPWFVGSIGFRLITPKQSVKVVSTTVTYLTAAAFYSGGYLPKTTCQRGWKDKPPWVSLGGKLHVLPGFLQVARVSQLKVMDSAKMFAVPGVASSSARTSHCPCYSTQSLLSSFAYLVPLKCLSRKPCRSWIAALCRIPCCLWDHDVQYKQVPTCSGQLRVPVPFTQDKLSELY